MRALATKLDLLPYPSSEELITKVLHDSSLSQRTRYLRTLGAHFQQKSVSDISSTWALTSVERDFSSIKQACIELSKASKKRVQCNAYFTPAGMQGLPPHYDLHDVLIIQVEGSKDWKVWQPFRKSVSLETLLSDEVENLPTWTRTSPSNDFRLLKGQSFYINAGEPHVAVATDEASLHFSFGIYND